MGPLVRVLHLLAATRAAGADRLEVRVLASLWVPGDLGRFAGAVMALAGSGFSAWLTYVELFELDAICQWCVASAVIMTGLAVVTSLRFVAPRPAESARRRS